MSYVLSKPLFLYHDEVKVRCEGVFIRNLEKTTEVLRESHCSYNKLHNNALTWVYHGDTTMS